MSFPGRFPPTLAQAADLGRPGQLALIDLRDPVNPARMTFNDVRREVDAFAHGLSKLQIPRGARVGLLADNGWQSVCTALGAMRAGLVPVPLNYKLTKDTIDRLARVADLHIVLFEAEYEQVLPEGVSAQPIGVARSDDPAPFPDRSEPGDLCTILFTSGSTGLPKGVPLTHASQLWWMKKLHSFTRPGHTEILPVAVPFFHMAGFFLVPFSLATGATAVILRQFEPLAFLDTVDRFRCTFMASVTPVLARLVQYNSASSGRDFSSVSAIEIGAAPLNPSLLSQIKSTFPSARVLNHYGSTEAGWVVFGDHPNGLPVPDLSLGYPFPDLEVRLVDGDGPDRGMLEVRGPSVAEGYLGRPEETRERFRDGWFRTNDRMWRDVEGFFYFAGRSDDMIICNGQNIYPIEIEGRIEQHPDVQQVCVVGVPDELRGQVPVAFVVPRHGRQVESAVIQAYAREHGPAFQYPRIVQVLEQLPVAPSGKIDRMALAATARALAAECARPALASEPGE